MGVISGNSPLDTENWNVFSLSNYNALTAPTIFVTNSFLDSCLKPRNVRSILLGFLLY